MSTLRACEEIVANGPRTRARSAALPLGVLLLAAVIPAGAQYGQRDYWPPGPLRYGPCRQQPYYGYPNPCAQPPCPGSPELNAPSAGTPGNVAGPGQRRGPDRAEAPSAWPPASGPRTPAARPPSWRTPHGAIPAPRAPSTGRSYVSPSEPGNGYRYQGSMIEGPEGPAYHAFGTLPGLGTPYQRYGNMLYGPGSRCQLFGNTAVCW